MARVTRNAYRVLTVWMLLLMASYLLESWSRDRPSPLPLPSPELLQENLLLRKEVETLRRLRDLEEAGRQLYGAFDPIAARVVPFPDLDPRGHAVLVDRGERDGIRVGQGVVGPHGLVGRVAKVWSRWSWVRLADDRDFRVTAAPTGTVDPTSVVLSGAGEAGRLRPRFAERLPDFVEGQIWVTTGSEGVFPPRIVVAVVEVPRDPYVDTTLRLVATANPGDELLILAPPNLSGGGPR